MGWQTTKAIARTRRLTTAGVPPDVTGHWYREPADTNDGIAEFKRLPEDHRELPNPLADTRAVASAAHWRYLDALFEWARFYIMSEAELAEHRASRVRGEIGLDRKPQEDQA